MKALLIGLLFAGLALAGLHIADPHDFRGWFYIHETFGPQWGDNPTTPDAWANARTYGGIALTTLAVVAGLISVALLAGRGRGA